MTLHLFAIPALTPQPAQDEFNRFCLAQRVVNIERQFVADGANAYWALCVTVAVADTTLPDVLKASDSRSKYTMGRRLFDKPQGTRSVSRQVSGCSQAEISLDCRFYGSAQSIYTP